MNRKIIISLSVIAAVAAVVIGGTMSYFSDTETSNNNTFTAGAIDLKVSSHFSSANNNANGSGNIGATDLNNQALFHFSDLKPGDTGGGNFDIIATSNPYWSCMKATVDTKPENDVLEPETAAGDGSGNGSQEGELQDYLSFYLWNDLNGDGQYTPGNDALDRNLVALTLVQLQAAGYLPLADNTSASFFGSSALLPNVTKNLGYKYCFGTWGANPETAGLNCSGAGNQNKAQTDGITGTIDFTAIQSRNNTGFTCASMNQQPETITKTMDFGGSGWAGWSCPAGKTVVGGGVTSGTAAQSLAWKTGATAAPSYAFPISPTGYTYGASEEGWIVQAGPSGGSITFHVDCL